MFFAFWVWSKNENDDLEEEYKANVQCPSDTWNRFDADARNADQYKLTSYLGGPEDISEHYKDRGPENGPE